MRLSNIQIDRIYINSCVRDSSHIFRRPDNHYHLYYELFYVKHNFARMFINNSFYDLHAGDFILIPPREIHHTRYDAPTTRINIYFKPEDLIDSTFFSEKEFKDYFSEIGVFHIPKIYQDRIHSLFEEMLLEDTLEDISGVNILKLQLKQLFLYFIRYCTKNTDALRNLNIQDEQILNSARYILENYSKDIDLCTLASIAGFSPSYFSKKFKQTTGMGVKEYLSFLRLKQASTELLSSNASITEIALNCGFTNSNYFKDAFKKMYHLSPREYRKVYKKSSHNPLDLAE